MASLCLALQLSDEVLRTSGAIQMDSLFIDEGFGTLDSDSLSEVTDAMEALRQDGDRIIGVISHRPELTDRFAGLHTGEQRHRRIELDARAGRIEQGRCRATCAASFVRAA